MSLERDSCRAALRWGSETLDEAGLENSKRDAELLLCAAGGFDRLYLLTQGEDPLPAEALERYQKMIGRRRAREPVSRILGRRGFWTLELQVSPDTLDPRPDSETLIEAALQCAKDLPPRRRLLDLGTGTGALLLALLDCWPQASGLGVDISQKALEVAKANAVSNGLENRSSFLCMDWTGGLIGQYDLIISNPPYIPSDEIPGLEREVRCFDPLVALDGGADGLTFYRRLAEDARRLMEEGGLLVLEVGAGQARQVGKLLAAAGFRELSTHRDLAGHERCLIALR